MKDIDGEIRSKQALLVQLQEEIAILQRAQALLADNQSSQDHRQVWTHPRKGKITPKSIMGRAMAVLREAGSPLHAKLIHERLEAQGKKVNFPSLVGGLARMAKQERFFFRDKAPNTFGLLEEGGK